MSQETGHSPEAVLAAAFGQTAVDAGLQTQAQVTAPTDVPNLFVDLASAPAQPEAPAAPSAQAPAAPQVDAVAELQARIAAAERENAFLRGRLEAPAPAPAQTEAPATQTPVYDPAQHALTPEEMIAYKDSLPVIEKLTAQATMRLRAEFDARLQDAAQRNTTLEQTLKNMQSTVAQADEVALMHTVRASVPDLDSVTKTPAWKQYLATRAPFAGGQSVRDVLGRAVAARDAETIAEHVMAFKTSHNISAPPPVVPAPGRTAASSAVGLDIPQAQRGISASALDEAMAKVQAGTLAKDTLDNMYVQLLGAAAAGAQLVQ